MPKNKMRRKAGLDLIEDGIIKKKPSNSDSIYKGVFNLESAKGIVYITQNSPQYISGEMRLLGKGNGQYPYGYKEALWELFGQCKDSQKEIEICSGWVKDSPNLITVDVNPDRHPTHIEDGQNLPEEWKSEFDRYYADPPYSEKNAKRMYGTSLPSWTKLLREAAKVVKPGGLIFLLLGNVHMQWHPKEVIQIGRIILSIIPNQESRVLHCYIKKPDIDNSGLVQQNVAYHHIQPLTTYLSMDTNNKSIGSRV